MFGYGKKHDKPQWIPEALVGIMDSPEMASIDGKLIKWAFVTLRLSCGLGMPKPVTVFIDKDGFVLRWEAKNGRSLEVTTRMDQTVGIKSRLGSEDEEKCQDLDFGFLTHLFTAWSAS